MTPLLEAYLGFYEQELTNVLDKPKAAEALIRTHSPKERLAVYLEWNGIVGFTSRIWAISQGEF